MIASLYLAIHTFLLKIENNKSQILSSEKIEILGYQLKISRII